MTVKSKMLSTLVLAGIALSGTGCATTTAQDLDAKFAAGWRPSKGYCAFGGGTPTLGAWCAEVNFGGKGLEMIARAANEKVLARAEGNELICTEHVAQVRRELAAYPGYELTDLYSCEANPKMEDGRPVCHVSLMVASAASGARFVIDNGHVLAPDSTGGVAPLADFVALVDHHWTGQAPGEFAFASPRARKDQP